jgi:hypothetical protein
MVMDNEKLRAAPAWEVAENRDGPLFKFRGFDATKDLNPDYQGYAASLLRDGLIYCASPFEMNDPWEARPAFSAPSQAFDHPECQAFVEVLLDGRPESEKPRGRELLRRVGFEAACNEMQDTHRENQKYFGIYSMATDCGHPLQWGYYADGHRGFCWVIDNKISPFARAAKVDYADERPAIEWVRWKQLDLVKLSLLTKSRHWHHEGEYRILVPENDRPDVYQVIPHNGTGAKGMGKYLRVPHEAIAGVIFGHDMPRSQAGAIVRLARQFGRTLEYRCALLHRRSFEMATRLLRPEEVEHIAGLSL